MTSAAKKHLSRSETETIKWQYVGSEEGWFSTYPANQDSACDSYDPRFRPWYRRAKHTRTRARAHTHAPLLHVRAHIR